MFAELANSLAIAEPCNFRNVTLVPIKSKCGPLSPVAAKSLDDAISDGTLRITEVSEQGSVPELRAKNFDENPVLILDGEELIGAKQNRIANVTVLVAAWSEIVIPVSCIEAGRWDYSRPNFAAAGRVASHKLRARKAEFVTDNLRHRRSRFSNQSAVWDDVREALHGLGAYSPTAALSDGFKSRADAIDSYLAAFTPQPGQVGVIYRIDGILAGLDLFGSEALFARAFAKLLRGCALQALAGFKTNAATAMQESDLLDLALRAPVDTFPGVGIGKERHIRSTEIGGGALELDGGLVHLFAFPRQSSDGDFAI